MRIYSLFAILFYGLIAVAWNSLTRSVSGTVTAPAGMIWRSQDIYTVTGLIAIFAMDTFTILGLVKLIGGLPAVQNIPTETPSPATAPYSLTHPIDGAM